MEILIYKTRRLLEVWQEGRCTHCFPVGIGRGGPGHKQREGDLRTPEGEYRICVKNPRSRFHLSLGIDYPNSRDALAGHQAGLISDEELRAITEAQAAGRTPPAKTLLGGEIYLHGHREKKDSTRGCVCLDDADVTALFHLAPIGTKVTIVA